MIIWIDGTYGIGKTTVSLKVKEKLNNNSIEFLDSDFYWHKFLTSCVGGNVLPQTNEKFLSEFKNIVEEKSAHKDIIIAMAITQKECKEQLFDYLKSIGRNIKHFILTSSGETIKSRIEHDDARDKGFALQHLITNILFLNEAFTHDAIYINTDKKNPCAIANEIISIAYNL